MFILIFDLNAFRNQESLGALHKFIRWDPFGSAVVLSTDGHRLGAAVGMVGNKLNVLAILELVPYIGDRLQMILIRVDPIYHNATHRGFDPKRVGVKEIFEYHSVRYPRVLNVQLVICVLYVPKNEVGKWSDGVENAFFKVSAALDHCADAVFLA